jgi:hypothetical protein
MPRIVWLLSYGFVQLRKPPVNLTIPKFDKGLHNRRAFSCGFVPIDNFLKSSLSDQIKAGMVTAWITIAGDDPAALGFYTLGAMAVRANLGPKKWQRAGISDIPVIYVSAVAVHEKITRYGPWNCAGDRCDEALPLDRSTDGCSSHHPRRTQG